MDSIVENNYMLLLFSVSELIVIITYLYMIIMKSNYLVHKYFIFTIIIIFIIGILNEFLNSNKEDELLINDKEPEYDLKFD